MNKIVYTDDQNKIFYKMTDCGLAPMADALKIQISSSNVYNEMPFENRLIELLTAYDDALTARRSETLIRQAKLKSKMSFDDLTLSSERGFTPDTKKYIASLSWTYPGKVSNITVLGASGSGKTSLLCGIGYHCINQGMTVRYYKANQLLNDLLSNSVYKVRSLKSIIRRCKVLIIDDLGMNKASDEATNIFYDLLDERLNELPVLIGSQVNEEGLRACFTGKAQSDGIIRRLFHHSINIVLKGDPESAEASLHNMVLEEPTQTSSDEEAPHD